MMRAVTPIPYLQMCTDAVVHLLDQERDEITRNLNAHSSGRLKRDEVISDFGQTRENAHRQ